MTWRFIDLDITDNVFGPAAFESIMLAREREKVPDTVLFWRPAKPAVYIGYHQKAYEDLNVGRCVELGIPIVRRILGGGTGYCDRDQIIYNVIFSEENSAMPYGPRNVYMFVLQGLLNALRQLGVAEASIEQERFSVYVGNKKISGSGQLTSRGVVNSSGSFLVDFDFETMNQVLANPVKNLRPGISDPRDGMVCLKDLVGGISMQTTKESLRSGFEELLGPFSEGALTQYELDRAEKLREKYLSEEWIFRSDIREKKRERLKKRG